MRAFGILLIALLTTRVGWTEEPEKWALLQRAVLVTQDADEIRSLVASGLNLNDPIGCGTFAPLDGAVTRENPDLLSLLFSLGAKPLDRQLVAAAFVADDQAALKMVKLLRAAGVSVNARAYFEGSKKFNTALHQAVWRENVELVQYLLGEPGVRLDELGVDGYTPLMIAVERQNSDLFEMLLAAGANPAIRNARGLDAAAVARKVIARQEQFLSKLQQRAAGTPPVR